MKRGSITIQNVGSNGLRFSIELSDDGTVWMTKGEIASLFIVFHSSVEANLKSLFRSGQLQGDRVKKEIQHRLGSGQKCTVEYYNLEAIISLGFQMNSYTCAQFRQWVAKQLSGSSKKNPPLIMMLGKPLAKD